MATASDFEVRIDLDEVERILSTLVSWDRKALMVDALKAGANVFREQTRAIFKSKMPTADRKMHSGIVIKSRVDDCYVSVYINKHPLNHIFELGTTERYIKKDHAKDDTSSNGKRLRKTYKAGEFRGAIKPLNFLAESKNKIEPANQAAETKLKELLEDIINKN